MEGEGSLGGIEEEGRGNIKDPSPGLQPFRLSADLSRWERCAFRYDGVCIPDRMTLRTA
jgi:hypothetical protein